MLSDLGVILSTGQRTCMCLRAGSSLVLEPASPSLVSKQGSVCSHHFAQRLIIKSTFSYIPRSLLSMSHCSLTEGITS